MTDAKRLERTPQALADVFEPTLIEKRGRTTVVCQGESEAVLLAHELGKRGWKAEATQAITGSIEELRLADVVRCTGRKKGASK